MTAPTTQVLDPFMSTLQALDKDLIITFAVPGFVLLILIEMVIVRLAHRGRYEVRDSATSLMMGFGNQVAGILFGGIAVLSYFWLYDYRLFDLGWTWPVLVACFFADQQALLLMVVIHD